MIGSSVAKHFVDAGYHVFILGRDEKKLHEIKERLGEACQVCVGDVSDASGMRALFTGLESRIKYLNVLVTTAGIYGEINALTNADSDHWQDAFRVNVFGTMHAVKYALPLLRRSENGKVIVFAGGGEGPLPHLSSYAASKAAVIRFAESVAVELSGECISVNAIYPGLINSGFVHSIIAAGPERAGETVYQDACAQVSGKMETIGPELAAQFCLFLASEEMAGVTGKLFAARWDDPDTILKHREDIMTSDIYTARRIKPKDRGYDW